MCKDVLAKQWRQQKEELVILWTPLDYIEETYSSDKFELLSPLTITKPVMGMIWITQSCKCLSSRLTIRETSAVLGTNEQKVFVAGTTRQLLAVCSSLQLLDGIVDRYT